MLDKSLAVHAQKKNRSKEGDILFRGLKHFASVVGQNCRTRFETITLTYDLGIQT